MPNNVDPYKDKRQLVLVALGCCIYLFIFFPQNFRQSGRNLDLGIALTDNTLRVIERKNNSFFQFIYIDQQASQSSHCGEVPAQFVSFLNLPMPINKANAQDLTRLPGIGPKTAEKIVALRSKLGRISNIQNLKQIKGIGPKLVHKLTPLLCFD